VALSGDGGDELFGGYTRYQNKKLRMLWKIFRLSPQRLLAKTKTLIDTIPYPDSAFGIKTLDRFKLLNDLGSCSSFKSFYNHAISQWRNNPVIVNQLDRVIGIDASIISQIRDPMHKMMAMDTMNYLPNDILVKLDRASMAVSLETRVPLLDYRVVEYAWSLPNKYKIKGDQTKLILRKLLYRHVPRKLIDRPKKGFGLPIAEWMSGPLREWAEEFISTKALKDTGIFDYKLIRGHWLRFLKGDKRWAQPVWLVIIYQSWIKNNDILN
jgi:asparagine synthase (glutamine-hydrolysing)